MGNGEQRSAEGAAGGRTHTSSPGPSLAKGEEVSGLARDSTRLAGNPTRGVPPPPPLLNKPLHRFSAGAQGDDSCEREGVLFFERARDVSGPYGRERAGEPAA
jgi:hypothetical protein